ncbi:MAG: M20/M25/M40 family metallo-hydrolase [Phycisphaeraceae bacterium]
MTDNMLLDAGTLDRRLQAALPDALDALRQMVDVNSFTHNAAGVNRVGELTADLFEPLGFKPERPQAIDCAFDRPSPLGKHLFLVRPGRSERRVGMVGHLDTVFTETDEQANDFRWREVGERIYGPGTVDIKGGNVQIWLVLTALRDVAPALFDAVTWLVMFNAAEEGLNTDFGAQERRRLGPDALANLVFEGGGFSNDTHSLISHRKGRLRLTATAHGRGAHAGAQHERGANAVVQISQFIERASTLTDYERDLTCNVGAVHGGTVPNCVPHHAEAVLEMRAFDNAVLDRALADVMKLDGMSTVRSASDGFQTRVDLRCTQHLPCWPANPDTQRLIDRWREAGASLGVRVEGRGRGGLSDGNFTQSTTPTIDGLGPAGGNAHCAVRTDDGSVDQEYMLPATMVPRAVLTVLAIEGLVADEGLL